MALIEFSQPFEQQRCIVCMLPRTCSERGFIRKLSKTAGRTWGMPPCTHPAHFVQGPGETNCVVASNGSQAIPQRSGFRIVNLEQRRNVSRGRKSHGAHIIITYRSAGRLQYKHPGNSARARIDAIRSRRIC